MALVARFMSPAVHMMLLRLHREQTLQREPVTTGGKGFASFLRAREPGEGLPVACIKGPGVMKARNQPSATNYCILMKDQGHKLLLEDPTEAK